MPRTPRRHSRTPSATAELWRLHTPAGVEVRAALADGFEGAELMWYVANQLSGRRQFTSREGALACADRMRAGIAATDERRA